MGDVNKLLCLQKFVDIAQQCFNFTPQANFPAKIWISTEILHDDRIEYFLL